MLIHLFLGLLFMGGLQATFIEISCNSHYDCPDGNYCYQPSGLCAPCVVCSRYNRRESTTLTCPSVPLECGLCNEGFEEEILNGGGRRDYCRRPVAEAQTSPSQPAGFTATGLSSYTPILNWIIGLPLFLGIIILYIVLQKYQLNNRNIVAASGINVIPAPVCCNPPPHYEGRLPVHVPVYPNAPSPSTSSESVTPVVTGSFTDKGKVTGCAQEKLVQAVPFYPPYHDDPQSDAESAEGDHYSQDDFIDGLGSRVASPPSLDDESTMPSDWTPGLQFQNTEETTCLNMSETRMKRSSGEVGSSDDEDEHCPKRSCNEEQLCDSHLVQQNNYLTVNINRIIQMSNQSSHQTCPKDPKV